MNKCNQVAPTNQRSTQRPKKARKWTKMESAVVSTLDEAFDAYKEFDSIYAVRSSLEVYPTLWTAVYYNCDYGELIRKIRGEPPRNASFVDSMAPLIEKIKTSIIDLGLDRCPECKRNKTCPQIQPCKFMIYETMMLVHCGHLTLKGKFLRKPTMRLHS